MKELLFNSFASTVYKVLSAVLKFFLLLIITNSFGADNYGVYALTMSVFLLINSLFRFGYDVYLHKSIAGLFKNNKLEMQKIFLTKSLFSFKFLFVLSLLFFLIIGLFDNEGDRVISLKYLMLFSSLYSFLWLYIYYLRGINKGRFSVFVLEIVFPSLNIILILIFKSLLIDPILILVFSFGFSIILSTIVILLFDKLPLSLILNYDFLDFKEFKNINRSLPYLLITITSMILGWIDLYVLSFFEGDSNIGVYSLSTRMALFMLFPASAISIFLSNKLVYLFNSNKKEELIVTVKKINIILFIVGLVFFIGINLFGENLLMLFGKEFKAGSSILLILSTAQLINISFASFETVILMSTYKKQLFNLNVIVILFNLFVNLILIYYLGLIGVAYGTLMTIILNKSLQYLIVKNKVLKHEFVKTN